MSILTDDFILSLEYYHDNDELVKIIGIEETFYDIINNKKIKLNLIKDEPEQVLKELIFKDIVYQQLTIKNENFIDEINIDSNVKYLLVFDNMQLYNDNVKLMKEIIFRYNYEIYVPSVYIFENLMKYKKMDTLINNIKKLDKNIIIDNPFDVNNDIKENKKQLARNIGVYKHNNTYSILNFNNISKTKNKKNINNVKEEIQNVKSYIEYYSNNDEFYNMFLKDAHNEIKCLYNDKNKLDDLTYEEFLKMTNVIKLILGVKETRDTYYIIELQQYIKNTNYKPVYITKDEISNIRCVINKISSINIYPSIPRYFCYVDNNKIIIKLFSIFFDFDNSKDYRKNKFLDNFENITKNSKALITKIMTGGYINMSNMTLDKTFDKIKYTNKKESYVDIDMFQNIELVKKYLISKSSKTNEFSKILINDKNYLQKYINNDIEYINKLDELKEILRNLLLIESMYSYDDIMALNDVPEIRKSFTGLIRFLDVWYNKYVYYADNIPELTNCILASHYLNCIIYYDNFVNDDKRNFIKNHLLKEFYDEHSILLYQIIFDINEVVKDYKNYENDIIKLTRDGSIGELLDYDMRDFYDND